MFIFKLNIVKAMKLEQSDISLLFSNTIIPDAFFTEYISSASGDSVKIFLYLFFLSKYNKDVKINDLSKQLNLPLKVIQESIKYWEGLGLIIRKNSGYEFANLQDIQLHKLFTPKVALSPEELQASAENQYRAKAIENINSEFFQGVMSPTWYSDINLWFNKYGFDEEVMIALFRYCFERSALHPKYIQTVADAWAKNNIKTFADLDNYYEKQDKLLKIQKTIAKKLRLTRPLSIYECAYIEKWICDFDYGLDIIEIALKKTTSKANPNFDYLDKLISDWHEKGLKTADAVQNYLQSMKQKTKDIKEFDKKSSYVDYEQRIYNNLSDLYANIPKKQD